jgi:ComF family protein
VSPPLCRRCGAPTAWPVERCLECSGRRLAFASARAALTYERSTRALVAAWKERGLRRLTPALADLVVDQVVRPCADALVAVPGAAERVRRRGHDPVGALARELGRRWELPVITSLGRSADRPRQRGLDRGARRANVREAFVVTGRPPAQVVLVDDVYTTGATAGAAAAALRRAGAARVEVVVLARALRQGSPAGLGLRAMR